MRYINPSTRAFQFQKAWFFLDNDVLLVMISNISSAMNAFVFSVLDQRLHTGSVIVDGEDTQSMTNATPETLWHGGVGYVLSGLNGLASLSVEIGEKIGAWSTIGVSTRPPATVDLFAAYIQHSDISVPISYAAFPGTTYADFLAKSSSEGSRIDGFPRNGCPSEC